MEPKITVEGTKMLIEVDLSTQGQPSKSGKSIILASTSGNKKINFNGQDVYIGLNVYKYAQAR